MLKDRQAAGNDYILELRSVGNVNLLALFANNNNSALESNILTKANIASNGQVVKLNNLGNVWNVLLEIANLLKVVAQLDKRRASNRSGLSSSWPRFIE